MSERKVALIVAAIGGLVLTIGVGLIYLPAGVIVGGLLLMALGMFAIDVDKQEPPKP